MNSVMKADLSNRQGNLRWKLTAAAATTCLLVVNAAAQPVNDAFANRLTLSGTNVLITNSLAYASGEPDEPFVMDVSTGQTAWWSWTALDSGIASLSAEVAAFAPLLAVYVGDALPSLSLVASNNFLSCYSGGCGCHWSLRKQISFHVKKGQTYQIAVDSAVVTSVTNGYIEMPFPYYTNPPAGWTRTWGWGSMWTTNVLAGESYSLQLTLPPRPANDDFNHPILLQGKRPQLSLSNAGATKEDGEPNHLENSGGSSVWLAWKAPASGQVMLAPREPPLYQAPSSTSFGCFAWLVSSFPTCGSEYEAAPITFYPVFGVYTGSTVDALSSAGALAVGLSAYTNGVYFDAVKGQVYHIAFDGNRGTTDNIKFHLALTTPAVNDRFERRIALHSIYATAKGYNAGASLQPGDPAPPSGSLGKTVWWSWQAPVSGPVTIDLAGSDFSFPVQVFAGTSQRNLALMARGAGSVSFEAVVGRTYQIAVYDVEGQTGTIQLALNAPMTMLPLNRALSRGGLALLEFASTPRQQVLLQRSLSGDNWANLRTVSARRESVLFLVSPPPSATGPFYRAIVIDRKF